MKDRLGDAIRKLQGLKIDVDGVVKRLRAGESKQRVGADIGVHPRWLSDLNPLLERAAAEQEEVDVVAGLGDDEQANMAALRRLLVKGMPLAKRAKLMMKMASDTSNAGIAARMLERIDDITGIVPSKIPLEPDPPPLFALPENSMPALMSYEEWLAGRRGDRGPLPPEMQKGSTETPTAPALPNGDTPSPSPSVGAPSPSPKPERIH